MKQLKYYLIAIALIVGLMKVCGNQAEEEERLSLQDNTESYEATAETDHKEQDKQTGDKQETSTSSAARAQARQLELPALRDESGEIILRRKGYTASYNTSTRLPNWVAWHLTADHVDGDNNRDGLQFHEDESVPTPRATNDDYRNSGYDRGHMCPSGDNKWDRDAQWESFYYTNACPQNHSLNRGDWNEMEIQCRKWAREFGDIYIVCGPILFKGKHKTIGDNEVVVPEAFFKVVLCMQGTPKAIGFIYRNIEGNRPKGDYVNSVDQVERITGYDFFPALPDDVEKAVEAEANLDDWY